MLDAGGRRHSVGLKTVVRCTAFEVDEFFDVKSAPIRVKTRRLLDDFLFLFLSSDFISWSRNW